MNKSKTEKKYPIFSERLRLQRKANRLTQERVAALLNVERSTYAKYETGQSMPHQETLLGLAELFQVSIDYLLGNVIDKCAPCCELRDDGTLPGLDAEETAILSAFRKLTGEQRDSLLNIAYNYNALNAAIKAAKVGE